MKPEQSPIPRGSLPVIAAPPELWALIERELDAQRRRIPAMPWWRWAVAAVVVVLVAGFWIARVSRPAWDVEKLIAGKRVSARVHEGEWIETAGNAHAEIRVGSIGVVDVEPNSRVRIVAAKTAEHRLQLGEGVIEATIDAPPRLFFVNTPATIAVDLGCAYRMESDAAGNGELRVTAGWVALERPSGEAMIPAGARAIIRRSSGPGTPYFVDASAEFMKSVDNFDERGADLDRILELARARDTLTLWNLLGRTNGDERRRIFNRIAALVPVPDTVSREKVLALDQDSLKQLREELAWQW